MRPEVLPWHWFCQDAFYLFCKGGVSSICRINALREVWLLQLERDGCAQSPHSWFQSGGQLCAIPAPWLWHSGARTGGTSQTERRSEGKAGSRCGLCTGASQVPPSVFHSAEAVAHGNGAGPALLPHAADAGSGVLRRFAGVSRSPPAVCCSLVLTQRGLIPLCPLHGPQHPGCATSRARQGRVRASVVIPGLFDHLFLRSNPQALPGTKKPTVVCCPQLEAYHCTSGTAVNFRNVTLNIFIFFFFTK